MKKARSKDSVARFLKIIDMASVELAGYELSDEEDGFYVTDNFFHMLGIYDVDISALTKKEFENIWNQLKEKTRYSVTDNGSELYKLVLSNGSTKYLRGEETTQNGITYGLIEDITCSTMEKLQVEKERDSDMLTGLYTRRAFRREAERLVADKDVMKQGALLMIDLDNLKNTNDRFGHNTGDMYIKTAADCFAKNTPDNTVISRISGDEFMLLFYGYDEEEEILEKVEELYAAIHETTFILPNGEDMGISASGGLSWYPQDSEKLARLAKYSDFAMYQMKRGVKGGFAEFDFSKYEQYLIRNKKKQEFYRMLQEDVVRYHFQPIFNSASGEPYAYEALMRLDLPTLRSPGTVIEFAREEKKLREIEKISIFKASEYYKKLRDKNVVSKNAYLFINSIASVCLSQEDNDMYHKMFWEMQHRVVVEITEVEEMNEEYVEIKKSVEGFPGLFALDDYGSGYNNEKNLLKLGPQFVKVDISIIRDIDKDKDKQQIVSNLVDYAHKRDMKVVSEGIETAEELETVLQLGTDLLQGYFLARPAAIPNTIAPEALAVIRQFHSGDKMNIN
jgi:diguanylate cyclase (GGDEF)-like protein